MSDNKNPEEAVKQLAKAARDLAELRRIVCGDLPAQGGVVSMEDRLGIIERQLVSAAVAQDEPQTTQPLDAGPDFQDLALTDIEWGIPKTDPKSDSTDTIILRPCEADGNEYVDAVDVVVYLRNDRSDVQLGSRGWLAKVAADPEADPPVTAVVGTILSFQRFPWDVGSPAVHGVLIGEGQDPRVAVSSADTVPGFLRYTAGDVQDHHKIVGDAEADADAATTGEWIECEIINAAGEEQLKIKHVGPGASCCCCAACLLTGIDIDAKGHVRQFRYDNGAGPYWTGII